MDVSLRRAHYAKLSTALAHVDDAALGDVLERSVHPVWSTTQTIDIADAKVLVKAIPLTDLERGHGFTTTNLYELPPSYQYGVGSAGFGVWRELITSLTVSNWVLEGVAEEFALLYHWRVIARSRHTVSGNGPRLSDYVRTWNSNAAIGRYAQDRRDANHHLLLFLEWFPMSLWDHFANRPDDIEAMIDQLLRSVAFLHERGVFHYDAHFSNVVTDGNRPYLVDFGLAVDETFDLASEERAFLGRHRHYDYGEVLHSLGSQLALWYERLTETEQEGVRDRLEAPNEPTAIHHALISTTERLAGLAPPPLVDTVVRYRAVIEYMHWFFLQQRANERKDTPFDDALLRQLLVEAGIAPDDLR